MTYSKITLYTILAFLLTTFSTEGHANRSQTTRYISKQSLDVMWRADETKQLQARENLTLTNLRRQQIRNWIGRRVLNIFQFDHESAFDTLHANTKHFTQRGWRGFARALEKDNILGEMRIHKYALRPEMRRQPRIFHIGIFNGRIRWFVKTDITLHKVGKLKRRQAKRLTIVIQRVNQTEANPLGIAIDDWIMNNP